MRQIESWCGIWQRSQPTGQILWTYFRYSIYQTSCCLLLTHKTVLDYGPQNCPARVAHELVELPWTCHSGGEFKWRWKITTTFRLVNFQWHFTLWKASRPTIEKKTWSAQIEKNPINMQRMLLLQLYAISICHSNWTFYYWTFSKTISLSNVYWIIKLAVFVLLFASFHCNWYSSAIFNHATWSWHMGTINYPSRIHFFLNTKTSCSFGHTVQMAAHHGRIHLRDGAIYYPKCSRC